MDVSLRLPEHLHIRLEAYAESTSQSPEEALDTALLRAMEPLPPPYRRARLLCGRCGYAVHRWVRTEARPGGFQHWFGCLGCHRLREHAWTPVL